MIDGDDEIQIVTPCMNQYGCGMSISKDLLHRSTQIEVDVFVYDQDITNITILWRECSIQGNEFQAHRVGFPFLVEVVSLPSKLSF